LHVMGEILEKDALGRGSGSPASLFKCPLRRC
jgi:hypothetical protein